jgi:GGDEF domain-containing protein
VFSDITERWRHNERLRHLAFHDPLTELPNRTLLLELLAQLLG